MAYNFTPGVERALQAAAQWSTAGEEGLALPVGPVETLLGLLAEPESRAAKLLGKYDLDEAQVRARFAGSSKFATPEATFAQRGLSAAVEGSLRDACTRLDESPRSFQWTTEYLLLGLTLAENDVGTWLREQGLDAAAIEREQAALYGGDRSPIAVDLTPIPLADPVVSRVASDALFQTHVASDAANGAHHAGNATLRIVDAAANRAGEALRVVEDYVRFVLDDQRLTRLCKELRHELTTALGSIPLESRLSARDVTHDVGTTISTTSEMTRRDPTDVASANLRRLQESLRSLEEFGKLVDVKIAARCEQLRYRAYELQRLVISESATVAAGVHPQRLKSRLDEARLYVLVDGRSSAEEFTSLVDRLVAAGVDVLQLRDKKLDDRTLLDRARLLRRETLGTSTLFIMNDRPDLAVCAEADGVHVGQEELSVAEVRRIVGREMLVGVSTHSIEQARQAVLDGADYLGVGPTFPSGTKSFDAFPGLDFVRAVAAEIDLPAFAIGGITPENVEEVVAAGLRRVAVSGAICGAADPVTAVKAFRECLK